MRRPHKAKLDKKALQDKIAYMIRNQEVDEMIMRNMTLQQLLEEVGIYHQELIFQNDELTQRERELEESRIKYQELFDDAPVGYIVMDQDYVIRTANKTFRRYFRLALKDVTGKKLTSFIHSDSQDAFYFTMRELNKTGKTDSADLEIAVPHDRLIVRVSSNVFLQGGERLIRCAFQDCTKQKRTENLVIAMSRKTEAERQRMAYVIEGSGVATWEWNVQTNETVFDNRWGDIVGYTLEELQPISIATWQRLVHPEDLERSNELLHQHFDQQTAEYICEARMKHKDGRWVWALSRGKVTEWTADGQPLRMFGIHIDITNIKTAYQELAAMHQEMLTLNETLEAANKSLVAEIGIRQEKELEVLRREKQYQATMSLLARPGEDIDGLLNTILHNAVQLIGAHGGYIALLDEQDENFLIRHTLGDYGETDRIQPVEQGLLGQVYRSGEILYVDNYCRSPYYPAAQMPQWLTTLLMVPLKMYGKVQGILAANWQDEVCPLTTEDIAGFRQFGLLASIAIERAHTSNKIFQQNERLQQLAYYDLLTGLPNRMHLNMYLEAEMQKASSGESAGAVMHIDLDDFKTINDHYGHTYGDEVIVAVGNDIVDAVRTGAYVARAGGDEFVVILPGADRTHIASIADRIISTIRKEYDVRGQRIHLSTSIGISVYPADAVTVEEIFKNADTALYAAKALGKNSWCLYKTEMSKDAYDQMVLTNSLRRSLECGELYLQYQPQIALPDRNIVGFEALLRWNSKEHGIVSPARFIPLAEQRGLIRRIGQWVIEEACHFARQLADMGRADLHVAVNVSPRQLEAKDFVDILRRCVNEAQIAPQQLEVEITETALIESLGESIEKLRHLDALGIRLSLDDFGTGYSSLTHLRNLPVETLKIDKSFIDRILDSEEEENFIRSIIEMAHVRKMNVVAEGVETEAQLAKLEQLECDSVQGYVFSKPVIEGEALRLIV